MGGELSRTGQTDILVRRVVPRQPFTVLDLPLALRLARFADARRGAASRRWLTKMSKSVFRLAHQRLGLAAPGHLGLDRGDSTTVDLVFDGRNTHYGHLYRKGGEAGYEPATAALIDCLVPDDGVFFDIGSNWGFFALLVASRAGFRGQVHAFEPLAEVFADLASIAEQAGLSDRVACHRIALSDRSGHATMDTGRGVHSALARLSDGTKGEKVETRRLEDLPLPAPDVMKVDVEGHEARLFAGASGVLTRHRPAVIFESWFAEDPNSMLAPFQVLCDIGYRFYRPMWRLGDGELVPDEEAEIQRNVPVDLALTPFEIAGRREITGDFNALAIHSERLAGLARQFRANGG